MIEELNQNVFFVIFQLEIGHEFFLHENLQGFGMAGGNANTRANIPSNMGCN